jgi:hypothetical protein
MRAFSCRRRTNGSRETASRSTAPFRPYARPDEFSRLRIRLHGEKVFEIRWDKAGGFKVVHYDQGDWERTLRAWPAPTFQ